MAGITLSQAEAKLTLYLAAEDAVLTGQSYEISGRRLTRANLAEIRAGTDHWQSRVVTLSNQASGRSRSRTMVPGG